MIGKKSRSNKANTASSTSSNNISHKTRVEGTISAQSNIRIDGTLIGSLTCKEKMIIGAQGHVEGNVECASAVIDGFFKGELIVKEKLIVTAAAKIDGDVRCGDLEILPGAQFNVNCNMKSTISIDQSRKDGKSSLQDVRVS